MRTPDDTGGRKGRCPNCQTKVMIPKDSVASSDSVSALEKSQAENRAPTAKPTSTASDTIELSCQSCGRSLKVPAANAGKKGKCPNCAAVMQIPTKSQASKSAAEQRWKGPPQSTSAAPQPTPQPTTPQPLSRKPAGQQPAAPQPAPAQPSAPPAGSKIEFRCSTCQKLVRVAATAAGQMGQCPQCKAVIKIPAPSTASPSDGSDSNRT